LKLLANIEGDISKLKSFIASVKNDTDLFQKVPKGFIFMRLKNLVIREGVSTTQANEIIVAFSIFGTSEAFCTATLISSLLMTYPFQM